MRLLCFLPICVAVLNACANKPTGPEPVGLSEDFLASFNRVVHGYADLDGDGVQEWFLGNPESAGQAGMAWVVLRRSDDIWYPMGELFLHPRAVRFLPPAPDGSARFIQYQRISGSEGVIATMTYRDGEFVVLDKEVVYPGDGGTEAGRRRYAQVFSVSNDSGQRLNVIAEGTHE